MSVVILLVVPTSGAKSSCLAYDGVHDRVNIGKSQKVAKVDFTSAGICISPSTVVCATDCTLQIAVSCVGREHLRRITSRPFVTHDG